MWREPGQHPALAVDITVCGNQLGQRAALAVDITAYGNQHPALVTSLAVATDSSSPHCLRDWQHALVASLLCMGTLVMTMTVLGSFHMASCDIT